MKYYIIHPPGKHPTAFTNKPRIECEFIEVITMDQHEKALEALKEENLVLKAKIRLARNHLTVSGV